MYLQLNVLDLLIQVMVLSDSLQTQGLWEVEQYTHVILDTIWLVLLLVLVSPVDHGVDHPLIAEVIIIRFYKQGQGFIQGGGVGTGPATLFFHSQRLCVTGF